MLFHGFMLINQKDGRCFADTKVPGTELEYNYNHYNHYKRQAYWVDESVPRRTPGTVANE